MYNKELLIEKKLPTISGDELLLQTKKDFFEGNANNHNTSYNTFIDKFENSLYQNKSINVRGLAEFRYKDVIVGCQHFIDNLIMIYGLNNLQLLEHGYGYYKKLNPYIKYATLETLDSTKPLVIEYPFPGYLGEHIHFKQIIEKCNKENIDVHLDCAWLTASFDLDYVFDYPCVKSIGMSLSKCFGLGWNRIGVRWRKYPVVDSITLQNENDMVSKTNVAIGSYYLDRLPMDYLVSKYRNKYFDVCKKLYLRPSNIIHAAFSIDRSKLFGLRDLLLNF